MTDEELHFIINAVSEIAENHKEWQKDYVYDSKSNEFFHKDEENKDARVNEWYRF